MTEPEIRTRDYPGGVAAGRAGPRLDDLRFNISLFEFLNSIETPGHQARCEGTVATAMRV